MKESNVRPHEPKTNEAISERKRSRVRHLFHWASLSQNDSPGLAINRNGGKAREQAVAKQSSLTRKHRRRVQARGHVFKFKWPDAHGGLRLGNGHFSQADSHLLQTLIGPHRRSHPLQRRGAPRVEAHPLLLVAIDRDWNAHSTATQLQRQS